MTDHIIYMDNAATTATRPEVLEAMLPYFTEHYGNPSSIHSVGRDARRAVEKARAQVAAALGAQPREIYFTAGGSESDNWAIRGAAYRALAAKGKHIITTPDRASRRPAHLPVAWKSRAMRSPICRWMKSVW